MHVNISELHVANDDHDGYGKVFIDQYLGPAAQKAIDSLVASNQDVASATLISEPQLIIIEPAQRAETEDDLRRMLRGFSGALTGWYDDLDELDLQMVSYHPNPALAAHKAYSSTHSDQFDS